jgi:toxin-antitoxin system PIN domain toxin
MKTTLDLPEDLAVEVQRRAAADGRDLADEVVELVRKGLAAPAVEPPPLARAVIVTDPDTGLPVILSPPDAPILRMTAEEFDAIVAAATAAYRAATAERPACFCRSTQQSVLRLLSLPALLHSYGVPGLSNQDALTTLDRFMASPTVAYRDEPARVVPLWHRLAALPTASPKVWMDAYLAAFAIAGGLELVTFDKGFSQFAGLTHTIVVPTTP